MGRELFREIGEPEDQRARRGGVDAGRGDGARAVADRRRRGDETAVLEGAAAAFRAVVAGCAAVVWPAQRVKAGQPILPIEAREVGIADGRRMIEQALLEARPGFGRGEGLGLDLVPPQP